jgi:hypothetical protein
MLFEEGKTWNSVVAGGGVAIEGNKKKHGQRKMLFVFR